MVRRSVAMRICASYDSTGKAVASDHELADEFFQTCLGRLSRGLSTQNGGETRSVVKVLHWARTNVLGRPDASSLKPV